jgi:Mu-like prophage I protein
MRHALDSASLFPRLFGEARPLSESIEHLAGHEVPKYKWIHVASEGLYRGHWQGAFELTREVFQAFVANLRAHPQFRAGARKLGETEVEGVGVRDVIQFDYEHASEMEATRGSIPQLGAPAPAWVQDVEVRSSADGRAELWALANLGEQIRGQIQRNEYRFVSIAFDIEHPHWQTGEDQGPTLTSIAFTNHPFLIDLESYAAANRRPGAQQADRLQDRASGNEAPVDNPTKGSAMNAAASQNLSSNADHERFRSRLCTALGVRTTLADDAVVDAAAEAATTGGGLKGLLEALGVKDAGAALKVIPELMAARSKLAETMQELDQLLAGNAAQEAAMAAGDATAVMKAKGWTDEALQRPLMSDRAQRMTDAENALVAERKAQGKPAPTVAERISCRANARVAFLKDNGVSDNPAVDPVLLTTPIAATKGGTQLSVPGSLPGARVLPPDGAGDATAATGETIDLRGVAGANPFEKIMTYLGSKDAGWPKLPHYQRCARASAFQRSNQFLF